MSSQVSYINKLEDLSEYSDKYQKHSIEFYQKRNFSLVPSDLSTGICDLKTKLNNFPRTRTASSTSMGLLETKDVMENVNENIFAKSKKASRTYYYFGKIPTNGLLDIYSMKDFETLASTYVPTKKQ